MTLLIVDLYSPTFGIVSVCLFLLDPLWQRISFVCARCWVDGIPFCLHLAALSMTLIFPHFITSKVTNTSFSN